ncbi:MULTISPECIES: chaperone NapD [Shewanella]|uniref:Chaperone NapD n=2 Tax=Shewanella TaxID=22 RepID=A0A1N6YNW1_9GAMM|nr:MULTISPECIES: chaperone NapD [Shewanella]MBP6519586.1 chaperone NapD [Shewanella sp.]MCL1086778.1 chaperone NapD [Shewanella glacialipiscicola]MCU7993489.1 chaperone NapD [Shewanella glacialipiscicola]MCU8007378.1 chaperone NapD [Shewanella sp. SM87]MCU8024806.1 chaperone NapD [Shewanella glacialipiscicola]
MSKEIHITSLVVQVLPQKMAEVRQQIMTIENAELSVNNEVKLVVVLEGDTQRAIMESIETINAIPGVLSATMVYHQSEELKEGEE